MPAIVTTEIEVLETCSLKVGPRSICANAKLPKRKDAIIKNRIVRIFNKTRKLSWLCPYALLLMHLRSTPYSKKLNPQELNSLRISFSAFHI